MATKTAKFPSTCPRCGEKIEPGTKITDESGKWTHVGCEVSEQFAQDSATNLQTAVSYLEARSLAGKLSNFELSVLNQYHSKGTLSTKQVAVVLDKAKKASSPSPANPDLPTPEQVPAGRYAIDYIKDGAPGVYLVHVWRGSRDPNVVRTYNDDTREEIRGDKRIRLLQKLVELGPFECAQRYGELRGRCSRCNAKLKDKVSVELLMGPVCIKYWHDDETCKRMKAAARFAIRARGEDPRAPAEVVGAKQLALSV